MCPAATSSLMKMTPGAAEGGGDPDTVGAGGGAAAPPVSRVKGQGALKRQATQTYADYCDNSVFTDTVARGAGGGRRRERGSELVRDERRYCVAGEEVPRHGVKRLAAGTDAVGAVERPVKRGRSSATSTHTAATAAAGAESGSSDQKQQQQRHLVSARATADSSRKPVMRASVSHDLVSDQIKKIFKCCRQSESTYKKKMLLLDRVHSLLRGTYQWFELHVVGSTCTGFACNSSDMDVCLYLTDQWIDQSSHAKCILSRVRGLLLRDFDFSVVLIRAKVPILRCTSASTGIQLDLNCNSVVGIRNTHLLRCYSLLDDRVSPLIVAVKLWAQSHDINDASRCTLSSYSLALMVIHFLQCGVEPAVLPNLQRQYQYKFSTSQPVSAIGKHDWLPSPHHTANSCSLSQLFSSFLHYYTKQFDFSVHVASVRTGTRLYKFQCANAQQGGGGEGHHGGWRFICVEEPFTRLNTARAVHDQAQFERITSVFSNSLTLLRKHKQLRFVFGALVDSSILRLI